MAKLDILSHFGLEVEVTAAMTDNFAFAPSAITSLDYEIRVKETDPEPLE
jgi:hypothetical protein